MHKCVPTPCKLLLGHLSQKYEVCFHYCITLSSIDCGCNQYFHLVPVSCHYYRVHVQMLTVCVICCIILLSGEKKCVLYYRIHIEFACSEAFFKSDILMHSDFRIIFPFNNGCKMCPILFFYCIQQLFSYDYPGYTLSTLILYLFCYNLLLYHSYDN